jgi:hypothetical protein
MYLDYLDLDLRFLLSLDLCLSISILRWPEMLSEEDVGGYFIHSKFVILTSAAACTLLIERDFDIEDGSRFLQVFNDKSL